VAEAIDKLVVSLPNSLEYRRSPKLNQLTDAAESGPPRLSQASFDGQ
jgi:hypothetical protein